ncbi:MAG: glutathione S-transferase C-terminal domain-containing protein [Gammaproteobacteria bacterium]|nr:glutathione S-transferase C-terminal domain-containing protein [Gammaproteobacteria bacterium]
MHDRAVSDAMAGDESRSQLAMHSSPARHSEVRRSVKALIDGTWHGDLEETPTVRSLLANSNQGFRHRVRAEKTARFPAQAHRYHLYVSYACPWAHRTIIYRKLKSLEDVITMSVLHPRWAGPNGWCFADSSLSTIDHFNGQDYLYEIYQAARPNYTGRVTVPVLWDRQNKTIVNNQSGDIIRMLNSAFDRWGDSTVDFYPRSLRAEIDAFNAWLIPNVCAAVYRVGFAKNQNAYDHAIVDLFAALDNIEQRLSQQPYLLGQRLTESDWHLFATLCRFDAAYFGALKCNLRQLTDYPALCDFTKRLHEIPGIAETVRFDHIKSHYYDAIGEINPMIVPRGPAVDYSQRQSAGSADADTGTELLKDRFLQEVLDLHRYLEDWMKGRIATEDSKPTRLADALAEDFIVIHPSGQQENKAEVIDNFAAAYGQKPKDYALEIRDVCVRRLEDGLCLVNYLESHRGESGRTRCSSALLRQRPGDRTIEWLFLQETLLAEA